MKRLFIANRGEIACRILAAAADRGLATVAAVTAAEAEAPFARRADAVARLPAEGAAAYLDGPALIAAAQASGADALHPGYGFLSESADFAAAVIAAGLVWVGPPPPVLASFGDKARARALAAAAGVPVLSGTGPIDAEGARAFLAALPPGAAIAMKAVAGGGGRGLRRVEAAADVAGAFAAAAREAEAAFGSGALYAEEWLPAARHIEVQLAGDGQAVIHLFERDCTLQRRHQKLVEMAPAPGLAAQLRDQLLDAALAIGRAVGLTSLATIEFLLAPDGRFAFIEANARLQVEHPVTEMVTGIDLVGLQLDLASGATLAGLGLAAPPAPRGHAVELRLLFETLLPDGRVKPAEGTVARFEPAGGPGIRCDSGIAGGSRVAPGFDSLAAKLVCHHPSPDPKAALARARRAAGETLVEGVATNLGFLCALLDQPEVGDLAWDTGLVDRLTPALAHHVGTAADAPAPSADGAVAPVAGVLVAHLVQPGDRVAAGAPVAVIEAMKMEHDVPAPFAGEVVTLAGVAGQQVAEGALLVALSPAEVEGEAGPGEAADPRAIRPDLAALLARRAAGQDASRPEAVARRHATGLRTARENLADLLDPGSFVEYGALTVAAQRRRRSMEDLIANTSGDGLVGGLGTVNAAEVGPERSRVVAASYDYMVLAGTQGHMNHLKKDRLFDLAARERLPVILFAEGGGGRPGDTDAPGVAGLDCMAFHLFARLSGKVPMIGIAAGRCFAGNAVLLGSCDVVIACAGSNIGLGGPAMIEGGGLGRFPPEAIGPLEVQVANGVVDIAVADEAEAVAAAKRYLRFFQGDCAHWEAPDPLLLRGLVPANRRKPYAMRAALEGIFDVGSLLELRAGFGVGLITALARLEGRAVGVIANNPAHLAGAIDAPAADKAARFLQLCDAFGLPVVSLVDCPGFMVGPEIEKTAMVRHACRMVVTGANLGVPLVALVLRRGYGLGAQAMAGGSFRAPHLIAAWPTGEFGGMNLEGAVRLGYRRELEAVTDPAAREALYAKLLAEAYARGEAVSMASHLEIDMVIDPAETRAVLSAALAGTRPRASGTRPFIDAW